MSMELTETIKAELGSEELAALRDLPGNKWPTGFRDLPDDAMIRVPSEFRGNVPRRRYARTPGELRRVIREAAAFFPGLDLADFEGDITHEAEHAAAARALGCTSRFIFTVAPIRDSAPDGAWYSVPGHVYTSRKPLSKLALAAIAAAPSWLSEGDLADLHRMGYRDADDVAGRIRKSGQQLPMPAGTRT
jgi:hypothetical protein